MANRVAKSSFRKGVRPKDPTLFFVQEDVDQGFRSMLKNTPFANGTILEVEFSSTDTKHPLDQTLPHKLDGGVKGFIIIDTFGFAAISRSPITGALADTHIHLVSFADCKVKFWVWR